MPHVFRTVAVFSSADEAFEAKARLEEAGVPASIDVDPMAGWSWHDPRAVSIVRLSVPADEDDRARELLSLWEPETANASAPASAAGDEDEEDWPCPKCATEVEAFLDVCWACGTTREGVEDPDFEPATAPIIDSPEGGPLSPWVAIFLIACPPALVIYLMTKVLFRPGAPEREPEAAETLPVVARDAGPVDARLRRLEAVRRDAVFPAWPGFPGGPDLDAILVRAWRTSVLGVLFFPPLLTIYSTWLVLKYFVLSDGARRRGQWRLYVSLAINLVVLLIVGYMVHLHLARAPAGTGDAGTSRAGTVCRSVWCEMAERAA